MGDNFAEAATLFSASRQSVNGACITNQLASDRAYLKRTLPGRTAHCKIRRNHLYPSFRFNAHLHFHSCLIDGIFAQSDNGLSFYKTVGITQKVIETAQETIRKRLLRLLVRRDLLSSDEAKAIQNWGNGGGFSLHARVQIAANDRKGLERLFRYCARPIVAGERLSWLEKDERLIYRLSKPQHNGQTELRLTPMEFLDRMVLLIPPPRCHRHRYHGVLAPNAPLRKAVSECAGLRVESEKAAVEEEETHSVDGEESTYSSLWAMLLGKIFEINPLLCLSCGGEMKMIAFVTDTEPIRKILHHIGELDHAPSISPSRDPPIFYAEIDQTQSWDDHAAKAITDMSLIKRSAGSLITG